MKDFAFGVNSIKIHDIYSVLVTEFEDIAADYSDKVIVVDIE